MKAIKAVLKELDQEYVILGEHSIFLPSLIKGVTEPLEKATGWFTSRDVQAELQMINMGYCQGFIITEPLPAQAPVDRGPVDRAAVLKWLNENLLGYREECGGDYGSYMRLDAIGEFASFDDDDEDRREEVLTIVYEYLQS